MPLNKSKQESCFSFKYVSIKAWALVLSIVALWLVLWLVANLGHVEVLHNFIHGLPFIALLVLAYKMLDPDDGPGWAP